MQSHPQGDALWPPPLPTLSGGMLLLLLLLAGAGPLDPPYPTPASDPLTRQVLRAHCPPRQWVQRVRLAHEALLLLKELLVAAGDEARE